MWILFVLLAGCDADTGSESGNAATVPGAAVTWHQEIVSCSSDIEEGFTEDVKIPVDFDAVLVFQALRCGPDGCVAEDSDLDVTDGIRTICRSGGGTVRVAWAE